jgi:hypothetical protein
VVKIGRYFAFQFWQHCKFLIVSSFFNFRTIFFSTWKVQIGDQNHASENDDANLLILDILSIAKHPLYNGVAAYFDIAVIETTNVTSSEAIRPLCLPRYLFYNKNCLGSFQVLWNKNCTTGNEEIMMKKFI